MLYRRMGYYPPISWGESGGGYLNWGGEGGGKDTLNNRPHSPSHHGNEDWSKSVTTSSSSSSSSSSKLVAASHQS